MIENDRKSSRLFRMLWIIAGTIFLTLGTIGIFLPLLPTTPFLLLSAACYFKGSKKMHDWLLNNRWFGSYIRNYREGKGVSARVKAMSIVALWITIGYSSIFVVNILLARIILALIAIGVTIHLVRLPTLRKANVPVTPVAA